jgi:hypothetical protein
MGIEVFAWPDRSRVMGRSRGWPDANEAAMPWPGVFRAIRDRRQPLPGEMHTNVSCWRSLPRSRQSD